MSDKNIIRKPILLDKNTVALLYIFHRFDHIDDMWSWDVDKLCEEEHDIHESAAIQFFEQMEGSYSRSFLEALIKEAEKRLDNF